MSNGALARTRRNWEQFARQDPMAAILDRDTDARAWTKERFFETGAIYCRHVLTEILARHGLPRAREQALDFGCGMGRLTNGLAPFFREVTGVDISQEMIRLAEQHRANPNVRFRHNPDADLGQFADGTFDLVLSVLVLQHIPPPATRRYIHEFIRVLRPGGIAVFQLPARTLHVEQGFFVNLWREIRRVAYRPGRLAEVPRRLPWLLGLEPRMEMHGLPQEDMARHIEAGGGRVVEIIEDGAAGPRVQSFLYLVTRP